MIEVLLPLAALFLIWGVVHLINEQLRARARQRARPRLSDVPPRRALPEGETPRDDGPLVTTVLQPSHHAPELLREVWAPTPQLPLPVLVLLNVFALVVTQVAAADEGSPRTPLLLLVQRRVAALRHQRLSLRPAPHPEDAAHPEQIPWRTAIMLGDEVIADGETVEVLRVLLHGHKGLFARLFETRDDRLRAIELIGETGELTLCFELIAQPATRNDRIEEVLSAELAEVAAALGAWPDERKEAARLLNLARAATPGGTLRRALLGAALARALSRTLERLIADPDPELLVWAWQSHPAPFEEPAHAEVLARDALAWLDALDALPPPELLAALVHLKAYEALPVLRQLDAAHGGVLDWSATRALRQHIASLEGAMRAEAGRGALSLSAEADRAGGLSLKTGEAGALSAASRDDEARDV